ncbi:substrate-binding periplasmic protein [Desulfospira joergensenii]|uniref:substrate-binding periplasmic protein n=1 Tax=Desulfospira joergensenii TaxID=53329 RepID=UPI0003B44374|nr:transporter substrate-binding domain-containing protein [Desulfospira joergensenii]
MPTYLVLFFLFLSQIMPCLSFAENSYPREVTICYGPWKPYEYREDNQTKGVNVEATEAAANTLGIGINWVAYPWNRCLESAKSGVVDGLMSLYRTAERETYLFYPDENLNIDKSVFITYPGSGVIFDGSLKSLTGEKVIVAQANSYGKAFDQANNFSKILAPSQENVILMVAVKRHRLGIGSKGFFENCIKKKKLSNQIVFIDPPYQIKTYFAFTRKKGEPYKNLAEDMGQALETFKKSRSYREIQIKYGFSPEK